MPQLHPDSAAIDRVGLPTITQHFDITRQAAHYWRQKGVPKSYRRALAALGEANGHEMPEMRQMRDRDPYSPTSGSSPTSSANPA